MERIPVVSGSFYPSSREELDKLLEDLLRKTTGKGVSRAVISPHAGYVYSGQTQAYAIRSLYPAKTFILLGNNHSSIGEPFATSGSTWITPLGNCNINMDMMQKIEASKLVWNDEIAHSQEHSIEVQIPFIQKLYPSSTIVPLSITNSNYSREFLRNCEELGKHIASVMGSSGIIASSDFSHYLPINEARDIDSKAIEKIMDLDIEGFFKSLDENNASICGFGPIAILMSIAREKGWEANILHHSSSGDITGENDSIVSYYAIGFE
jgi:AmmeMemoRadiSam system protein B